jgi:antitoxin HicB
MIYWLSMNRREFVTAHQYRYTVLFEPAEEGGFTVTCPSLPGLVTEGDTLEEARSMASDAIRGYLESLAKDGLPIPPEDPQPRATIIAETVAVAIEEA